MEAREFLKNELGHDLPDSMGNKIVDLMNRYMKIKVKKSAPIYWYSKNVGDLFEVDDTQHQLYYTVTDTGRSIWKDDCEEVLFCDILKEHMLAQHPKTFDDAFKPDAHYDNTHGSLYKFAEEHGLNAYEFDIIKRITRCRKKGQFKEDLEKTKRVIDLYLEEYESF
jgi:hypothetical protein